MSSPKISPQAENGLLEVTIRRRALVAAGDEHEHQVRGLRVERDVADLVADQQRDPLQAAEFVVELALALRVGEQRDPFGRGAEQDALAGEARADPQARSPGVSCRSRAGRAGSRSLGVQEVELAEVLDHLLLDGALEGEVELLERLAGGEPGGADPQPRRRRTRARRSRSRAAPRRTARSSTPPGGRARRASAAPWPPPAPSSPGTGA